MAYLDQISDDARIIGAVNTIHLQNGKFFGHNTDGIGFLNRLKETGHDPTGMRVLMLGAGGAARAATYSLAQAGVEQIIVVNRTVEHGIQLSEDMGRAFPDCHITFQPLNFATFHDLAKNIDLVVNATSVGMQPDTDFSLWPDDVPMPPDTIFYDLVYNPLNTLFLQRARAAGIRTIDGLGMLVHQGAFAFKKWAGQEAQIEVMRRSCSVVLGEQGT